MVLLWDKFYISNDHQNCSAMLILCKFELLKTFFSWIEKKFLETSIIKSENINGTHMHIIWTRNEGLT